MLKGTVSIYADKYTINYDIVVHLWRCIIEFEMLTFQGCSIRVLLYQ